MCVVPASGQQVQAGTAQTGRPAGSPELDAAKRCRSREDRQLGRRGEELVYLEELERVRAMGHENRGLDFGPLRPTARRSRHQVRWEGRPRALDRGQIDNGHRCYFEWPRKELRRR